MLAMAKTHECASDATYYRHFWWQFVVANCLQVDSSRLVAARPAVAISDASALFICGLQGAESHISLFMALLSFGMELSFS